MNALRLIAWKEFGDRLRSGWVIVCALVWLGAIALTSLFGLVQIGKIGLQGYERTVVSLLNLVQYLVPLLGLLLGHDLIVSEREERTWSLLVAGGTQRWKVLAGKFFGGSVALGFPLLLGFTIAGVIIALSATHAGLSAFLRLAVSGLALGIVFLGLGILISVLCRTRVKALVLALLAWCAAVFAFDLLAMGAVVITRTPQAAREVETATDSTHVRTTEDMHAAFEAGDDAAARSVAQAPKQFPVWLLLNPVDVFRAINLPTDVRWPALPFAGGFCVLLWLASSFAAASWKLNRMDL